MVQGSFSADAGWVARTMGGAATRSDAPASPSTGPDGERTATRRRHQAPESSVELRYVRRLD